MEPACLRQPARPARQYAGHALAARAAQRQAVDPRALSRAHQALSDPLLPARTWGSRSIDETLWAYDVLTARQHGARFAPLHFLSGGLFSQDIHRIYEAVPQPVWMSQGVRGDFKDFRGKRLVRDRGTSKYGKAPVCG